MFTGGNRVPEEGRVPEQSYRAFISYSHRDDAVARALHKRLETYRLPKHLIGSETPRGPLPKQLTPIFRDLDELSAADDLSAEIKAALARSEVLIILASPAAKASKWVNLEIENFRALHGNSRPVLVALIEGEPADAFPPALTAGGHEPVAADFRKSAPGGKRLALLKLVAGITAAPLDALVQRDAQRQYRRVMAITGSALAAALVMALLLVVALRSQAEAQRQRQEAEGLVEYMLTDLRDRLKGVGRLDVMTAVNERAMKYYGGQDVLDDLPAESLERRARILHAMGEDDVARGSLSAALIKFKEANRITAALLIQQPNEPARIFAHAQSEYWVGRIYELKKEWVPAYAQYRTYLRKSKTLIGIDSNNLKYIMEMGWSCLNIGIVQSEGFKQYQLAERFFSRSLYWFRKAEKKAPNDQSIKYEIANNIAWLADSYYYRNKFHESVNLRLQQLKIQQKIYDSDNNNLDKKFDLAVSEKSLSINLFKLGQFRQSKFIMMSAVTKLEFLNKIDHENKLWNTVLVDARHRMRDMSNKLNIVEN
jgi:tetratricopeptide (TPR) repeat protein